MANKAQVEGRVMLEGGAPDHQWLVEIMILLNKKLSHQQYAEIPFTHFLCTSPCSASVC